MTTAGQARNFYPALRVFVFGQEVTEDVLSLSVTLNDSRAPSTAQIVLANKGRTSGGDGVEDRYIVTETDILAMADVPLDIRLPDLDPVLNDFTSRILEVQQKAREAEHAASRDAFLRESTALQEQQLAFLRQKKDEIIAETESVTSELRRQIRANFAGAIQDPVKAGILATKVVETTSLESTFRGASGPGPELASIISELAAYRGDMKRYPMQVGDCIFHSNDPVRIFLRDPRNAKVWYHMFCGFVSDWVDDVDENNTKTVTLRCEDVLRPLRYARISTSPGLTDIEAAATGVDLVLRTFFNDDFSGMTLVEFVASMIFGFTRAGTLELARSSGNVFDDSISGTRTVKLINARGETTRASLPKDGCGLWSIDRSTVFVLASELTGGNLTDLGSTSVFTTSIDNLAVYQAVVDHQVRVTDLSSMALKANGVSPIDPTSLADEFGEVPIEKVITAIGENPQIYPVDGGRLIMLAPSTLGSGYNAGVLFQEFKGVELKTTWKTRLAKLFDVFERLEFSFYASPRGDLIAEMPLHHFDPEAFGEEPVTYRQIAEVLGDARAKTLFDEGHTVGPFAADYHIARRDTIRWQRTFSDEQVRTLITCEWYNVLLLASGQYSKTAGETPARRLAEALVPQFGVRMEEAEPTITIGDQRAAEVYCQILLNRFNGDARTVNVQALPQLRLMPNRPIKFTERAFIGTCREVNHQITWGERGEMSMDLRTNHIRGWDGSRDKKTNKPFYVHLGGFRADPQNYAIVLRSQQPEASSAKLSAPKQGTGE